LVKQFKSDSNISLGFSMQRQIRYWCCIFITYISFSLV